MRIPKSLYTKADVDAALNRMNISVVITDEEKAFVLDVPEDKVSAIFKNVTLCAVSRIAGERERFIVDTLYQNSLREMV